MDKSEIEKLKILLNHWIEHNKQHGEEFREWAEKARALGEVAVQKEMLGAAQYMDKASESLLRALEELNKAK
jgi:nickel/cobalt exporter